MSDPFDDLWGGGSSKPSSGPSYSPPFSGGSSSGGFLGGDDPFGHSPPPRSRRKNPLPVILAAIGVVLILSVVGGLIAWAVGAGKDPKPEVNLTATEPGVRPQETRPRETRPPETRPQETRPQETRPTETQPQETKPQETEPRETEPQAPALENAEIYYCYNLLNPKEQEIYLQILDGLMNMDEKMQFTGYSFDDLAKLVTYVHVDHPEIFWFHNEISGSAISFEGDAPITITPNYLMDAAERKSTQRQVDSYCAPLLAELQGKSGYEIVKTTYEYLVNNTIYDLNYGEQSIVDLMLHGRAVCTGYARSMQYILRQMGMKCLFVTGHDHAWNIVELDGDYYLVDATWGDPVSPDGTQSLSYAYLLVSSADTSAHITEDCFPVPECTATRYNYYRMEGRYFDTYSKADVVEAAVNCCREGIPVSLRFGNYQAFRDALNDLEEANGEVWDVFEQASARLGRKYTHNYYNTDEERLTITLNWE